MYVITYYCYFILSDQCLLSFGFTKFPPPKAKLSSSNTVQYYAIEKEYRLHELLLYSSVNKQYCTLSTRTVYYTLYFVKNTSNLVPGCVWPPWYYSIVQGPIQNI